MSLFRQYRDYEMVADGLSDNWGNSIPVPLRNRQFWLDGIIVTATIKTTAAISGATADCMRALVKRITLAVNEREDGSRNVVSIDGPAALEVAHQQTGFYDRHTLWTSAVSDGSAAGTWVINYPIYFRNPVLPEPVSLRTALPLPRYGTDPVLTVQLGNKADVASGLTVDTTFKGVRVQLQMMYREVIDPDGSFPHWKTELLSIPDYVWGATGQRATINLTQGGLLASMLQQDYRWTGSAFVRQSCLSDVYTDLYTVEYRNRNIIRSTPVDLVNYADMSVVVAQSIGDFNSYWYDFMSDLTETDVYNLRSCLDLSIDALKGGQLRVIASNIGNASSKSRFTTYKFLVDPARAISTVI